MSDKKLEQRLESFGQLISDREKKTPKQLPLWEEHLRGVPSSFMRSALFASVQSKDRKTFKKRTLIASQKDIEIYFFGIQFNQEDLDVWEQAVHLAREHPLGKECFFSANAFLKAMGRKTGKPEHEWLKDRIATLNSGTIEIKLGDYTYSGGLLVEFFRDDHKGLYRLVLNEKLLKLYNSGYTKLFLENQKALMRKPLAKWLFRYYTTHKKPHALKVETLRDLSGSSTKELKHFKTNLKKALQQLKDMGFLLSYHIDDEDKVHVNKA